MLPDALIVIASLMVAGLSGLIAMRLISDELKLKKSRVGQTEGHD